MSEADDGVWTFFEAEGTSIKDPKARWYLTQDYPVSALVDLTDDQSHK